MTKKKRGKGHKADGALNPTLGTLIITRLAARRRELTISQGEAAQKVGYTVDWLAGIEKSINPTDSNPNPTPRTPGLIATLKLCRIYKLRFEDLVRDPGADSDHDSDSSSH